MATKDAVQAPKAGRRTTGKTSAFHLWRVRNHLTQLACAPLLGVCHTTVQRWDAHEEAAPGYLTSALNYHSLMRDGIDELKETLAYRDRIGLQGDNIKGLDYDGLIRELGLDIRDHPLAEIIEQLGPIHRAAVLYGIEHGLWG